MAAGWSTEETRTFLGIWGAADVQAQLDGIVRNQAIYEKIATEMRDSGYDRTWNSARPRSPCLLICIYISMYYNYCLSALHGA